MTSQHQEEIKFNQEILSKYPPLIGMPTPPAIARAEWFKDYKLDQRVRVLGFPAFGNGIFSGKAHPAMGIALGNMKVGNFEGKKRAWVPSSGNFLKDFGEIVLPFGIEVNGVVSGIPEGKLMHAEVSKADVITVANGISPIEFARQRASESKEDIFIDQYTDEGSISGWQGVMEYLAQEMNRETHGAGANIAAVMGTCATLAAGHKYFRPAVRGRAKIIAVASKEGDKVPGSRTLAEVGKLEKIGGFAFRPEWNGVLDFPPVDTVTLEETYRRNVELIHETKQPIGPTGALDELGFYKLLEQCAKNGELNSLMNDAGQIVVCLILMDSYLAYLAELRPFFRSYRRRVE